MTHTKVARYDKGLVQGQTELTSEGYIKAKAIVTRCGVFLYKNPDGTIRKELRHPDDVLKEDSLESIKMIPIVNGHPPERLVSAENAKILSVGFTGELVENNDPYIIANMVITDKDTVKEIRDRKKNELSLGYTVDLIEDSGVYFGEPYEFRQTNIKYNHLAIVEEARAGSQARISLDRLDAEEVTKEDLIMTNKKQKKIKIDNVEYMVDEEAGNNIEKMISEKNALLKSKDELEDRIEQLENMLDKSNAERDSMRDKDFHNPEKTHNPLEEETEEENDEIGSNGKEVKETPRDYQKPTNMENHPVKNPKNEHYPNDLPNVSKVDSAEINKLVKNRVKLEKLSEKYLDKSTLSRIDSMSDLDIKKSLIKSMQPNAVLEGKSETYINARFDSVCEDLPKQKVIAMPSGYGMERDDEKDNANAEESRKRMIMNQKNAWKSGRK
jgi:hypothetical protein